MVKKIWTILLISIIAIFIIGAGIYYFVSISSRTFPADTESQTEDGFASMGATFYDENGNPIMRGVPQSFLGGLAPMVRFMSFNIKVRYVTGNADLNNLRYGTMTTPMSENIAVKTPLITTLAQTQTTYVTFLNTVARIGGGTCTLDSQCGSKENCITGNCLINLTKYESVDTSTPANTNFSLTIKYNITDPVTGLPSIGQESSYLGLVYDIRGEKCALRTFRVPYNTCANATTLNQSDNPQYCSNSTATGFVGLINRASICGCPPGQHVSGETCIADTCTDSSQTPVGQCHTYFNSLIGQPTANNRFCATNGQPLVQNCTATMTRCGVDFDTLPEACATDYNGNNAIACTTIGTCQYSATGGLGGCIPDCAGKAPGSPDGCGGTC